MWVDAALCRWVAFRFSQDKELSFILYKLGLFACFFFLNSVCLGSEPLTISRAFALSISQGSVYVCVWVCGGVWVYLCEWVWGGVSGYGLIYVDGCR